ncbi:MAG TPA: hypothetical protein VJ716_06945 [Gaiellaceae bacterium]|nr:hypothetical protein [Gaiellaceae bacterium]
MSAREPDFVLGPLATAGVLSLGWAAAKRSPKALAVGLAALALETNWPAYRRFKREPRFWALNLVTVRRDSAPDDEGDST